MRPTLSTSHAEPTLRIHAVVPVVRDILGPGCRLVIWVQGCSIHCIGCMMPEAWDHNGGVKMDPEELCRNFLAAGQVEGITVSGGEPFDQPEGLEQLLVHARQYGCTTWVYTGYTIEQLAAKRDQIFMRLLSLIDVLVDGRFKEDVGNSVRFRGSDNQRIIRLSGAISAEQLSVSGPAFEVSVDTNDRVMLVGMPPRGFFETFKERMHERGYVLNSEYFIPQAENTSRKDGGRRQRTRRQP